MEDKKLLELAAKAAGIKLAFDETDTELPCMPFDIDRGEFWNPLAYDGDALRLAVKLRLDLTIGDGNSCASWHVGEYGFHLQSPVENNGDDEYAATRRVIVRAAAEIGKNL